MKIYKVISLTLVLTFALAQTNGTFASETANASVLRRGDVLRPLAAEEKPLAQRVIIPPYEEEKPNAEKYLKLRRFASWAESVLRRCCGLKGNPATLQRPTGVSVYLVQKTRDELEINWELTGSATEARHIFVGQRRMIEAVGEIVRKWLAQNSISDADEIYTLAKLYTEEISRNAISAKSNFNISELIERRTHAYQTANLAGIYQKGLVNLNEVSAAVNNGIAQTIVRGRIIFQEKGLLLEIKNNTKPNPELRHKISEKFGYANGIRRNKDTHSVLALYGGIAMPDELQQALILDPANKTTALSGAGAGIPQVSTYAKLSGADFWWWVTSDRWTAFVLDVPLKKKRGGTLREADGLDCVLRPIAKAQREAQDPDQLSGRIVQELGLKHDISKGSLRPTVICGNNKFAFEKWRKMEIRFGDIEIPVNFCYMRLGRFFFIDEEDYLKLSDSLKRDLGANAIKIKNLKESTLNKPRLWHYTVATIAAMMSSDISRKHVIDCGAGDGILSLVAAKLGAVSIDLVDINEGSLRQARVNLELNGLKEGVDYQIIHGDLKNTAEISKRIRPGDAEVAIISNIGTWEGLYSVTNQHSIRLIEYIPNATLFIAGGYFAPSIHSRDDKEFIRRFGFVVDAEMAMYKEFHMEFDKGITAWIAVAKPKAVLGAISEDAVPYLSAQQKLVILLNELKEEDANLARLAEFYDGYRYLPAARKKMLKESADRLLGLVKRLPDFIDICDLEMAAMITDILNGLKSRNRRLGKWSFAAVFNNKIREINDSCDTVRKLCKQRREFLLVSLHNEKVFYERRWLASFLSRPSGTKPSLRRQKILLETNI